MVEARSPQAFVEELRALVARNTAANVELAARVNALLKRSVELSAGQPPADPAELLARWLDFNLAFYAVTSAHSLAAMNDLISAAEQAFTGQISSSPAARSEGPARLEVRLQARAGSSASCPFMVENQYDRPVDVTFEASPLVTSDAGVLPASLVDFVPPSLNVPARSQALGTAVIEIGADFVVGKTYRTTIRVLGFEGREIELALTIVPPEEAPRSSRTRRSARAPAKTKAPRPSSEKATEPPRRAAGRSAKPARPAKAPKQRRMRANDVLG